MQLKRPAILISVGMAVIAILTLMWLLGSSNTAVTAGPVRSAAGSTLATTSKEAARAPLSDATPIHYVTITGTDSGDCSTPAGACRTIQYAVDRAGEGDEVRVATGVYTGVNAYGGLSQVVYISKTVTVRGGYTTTYWITSNPISYPTTLNAEGAGRVLYISGYISPTVAGLRLTRGDAAGLGGGPSGLHAGGGVYVISAMVVITGNEIVDNSSPWYGGGLYLHESHDAVLVGNVVDGNFAHDGGGLYLYESSSTDVGDNIFINNGADNRGGGLYLDYSDATISGDFISANDTWSLCDYCGGGGLYLHFSAATLTSNTISANNADTSGGGAYLYRSDATLTRNTVSDNYAFAEAGGLLVYDSEATLTENTITTNEADSAGGLSLILDTSTLEGNIISNNSAKEVGGGLQLAGSSAILSGNMVMSNTIVWESGVGGGLVIDYGSDALLVNNVIANNHVRPSATGSGLVIAGATPRLLHNTIARNGGGDGSAVYVTNEFSRRSAVAMTDTILVSHTVGVTVTAGNTATLEGTLWGTGAWANEADWGGAGTISTGTVNLWGDPAFVNPVGGDYHIGTGSAAINAGVDAGVNEDIDGETRPQGMDFDIGADEFIGPHLIVTKQADPDPVQAGSPLTYTLRVTNTGTADLHATITDALPTHVTLGEASGGTLILPGGTLTWTPTITAPGGVWTERFVVTVELGYAGLLTNVVRVTSAEGATGVYTQTSESFVTPGLEVRKKAEPDSVRGGEQLTYTIRVTNTGNVDLHAIVTDTLPAGIIPGETTGGTALLPGGTLTWTATIAAPGGVWTEQVVVTAEEECDGLLTNRVEVRTLEGATGIYIAMSTCVQEVNQAPNVPSNPNPMDGATGVPVTQTLRWQGGDPDGDAVTYTVRMGAGSPPPIVGTTTATWYAYPLTTSSTFYWAITASDGISVTAGPVWSFATVGSVEYLIYLPLVTREY